MTDSQRRLRPAIERLLAEQVGYKLNFKSLNPNDGLVQLWQRNFVEFDASAAVEFAEPPDPKTIADVVETQVLPENVALLRLEQADNW